MLAFVVGMIGMAAIPTWSPLPSNTGKYADSGLLSDTITNTEIDTLYPGFILTSPWQYSVHVTLAAVSGTRAMKIYLDESNAKTGNTDWIAVDSLTPTTPINTYLMKGANVWGRRQRIRVKGNAGSTQVVKYAVQAVYKRTY